MACGLKDKWLRIFSRKMKKETPLKALACVLIALKMTRHTVCGFCIILCLLFRTELYSFIAKKKIFFN